jgi:DNA-directed RNA polymerase III subunit RPC5
LSFLISSRHLLQFPLRPIYAEPPTIQSAQWKPNHKKLELSVPYDKSIFGADNNKWAGDQKFGSSLIDQQPTMMLAAGVIRDGALHLTPLQDVLQIRPMFQGSSFLNETVEDMDDGELTNEEKGETKKPLQQVQMRRKENERIEQSRLHSYTHCKGKEEAEPWIPLPVHPIDAPETEDRFESLYHSTLIATDIL